MCTMDPEWDLLQMIHSLMAKMKDQPELDWVHSHQDDNPDVDITKSSGATKFNMKADALATQEMDQLDLNPKVPHTLDLSLQVFLHQRVTTITRDYKVSMGNNIQL